MAPVPEASVRVGVLGAGTVGAAFVRLLARHPECVVTAALVRDPERPRDLGPRPPRLTTDPDEAIAGADVVVELLGGVDWPTALMARAAERGARLVTANKAALAEAWPIWRPWIEDGRVGFEAAVMAGTPAIGPLTGALRGSRMRSLEAVLNGTCAYLIGEMERGVPCETALAEAQRMGYAEADPSLDVDGWDAAHKIAVVARMTVAPDLAWADVVPRVRGVRGLTPAWVRAERAAGRRVRLVAYVEPDGAGGWRVGVEPRSIEAERPLAFLADGRNALVYRGDAVGEVWIAGPGAGADVTASAVLADVLQAARGEPGPRPASAVASPLDASPTIPGTVAPPPA
ncbi:MAG: homoserine dehydrogenase [Trueperaceae bacterium]